MRVGIGCFDEARRLRRGVATYLGRGLRGRWAVRSRQCGFAAVLLGCLGRDELECLGGWGDGEKGGACVEWMACILRVWVLLHFIYEKKNMIIECEIMSFMWDVYIYDR